MKEVLSVILGGGRGTRLYPLTKYRAKPAVPLAGKYRLIDIPISNCLNSGLQKIYILTQFNSESLNKHIFRAYKFDFFSQGFVEILAAEQSVEQADWFQGSADAVRKCMKHFNQPGVKYVLILSGDQLYKMNLADLINFHVEKKSEITVACNPVGAKEILDLGIMGVNKESRINKFVEKPTKKEDIADLGVKIDGKDKFLASMGNYVFNKDVLFDLLLNNKKVDFGREILPEAIADKKTYAFVYNGYWKDIGSIDSFYQENLAFTDPHPPLDFFDENWPFFTRPRYLPMTKITDSSIESSNIAEGSIIEKANIIHSIIGLRSKVSADSVIEDSVLMGNDHYDYNSAESRAKIPALGIGRNCQVKKAIVDKNVRMGDNVKIINEKGLSEFGNEYCVIRSGITIIPKNTIIPPGTVI